MASVCSFNSILFSSFSSFFYFPELCITVWVCICNRSSVRPSLSLYDFWLSPIITGFFLPSNLVVFWKWTWQGKTVSDKSHAFSVAPSNAVSYKEKNNTWEVLTCSFSQTPHTVLNRFQCRPGTAMVIQWNLFQWLHLPLLFKWLQICKIITWNAVSLFIWTLQKTVIEQGN